jgi:hypothetical protein
MVTTVDAYGAVCRVLTYSSLAFGALNHLTLELTTPYSVNPNGACAVGCGPSTRRWVSALSLCCAKGTPSG